MTKILLIEEKQSGCQMLSQQLAQYGYDVLISVEGGDQGILLAIKEAPDVILVGSNISVIDGWQVIQILKASKVTQNIPTMALMEPTVAADWHMVLKSSCDDYCLKPVAFNYLLGKLEALVGYKSTPSKLTSSAKPSVDEGSDPQDNQKVSPILDVTSTRLQQTSDVSSEKELAVYIEDSQADSQAMANIIQENGYQYANIIDSLHALPQLLELKPQIIFLDLVMPVVNGYELCAQIRRISTFKAVPIIIVTNNDGIADRVRARIAGASGFLGKPIKKSRVTKVLQRYLQPASQQTPSKVHHGDYLPTF